jgi:hypothetical protein
MLNAEAVHRSKWRHWLGRPEMTAGRRIERERAQPIDFVPVALTVKDFFQASFPVSESMAKMVSELPATTTYRFLERS